MSCEIEQIWLPLHYLLGYDFTIFFVESYALITSRQQNLVDLSWHFLQGTPRKMGFCGWSTFFSIQAEHNVLNIFKCSIFLEWNKYILSLDWGKCTPSKKTLSCFNRNPSTEFKYEESGNVTVLRSRTNPLFWAHSTALRFWVSVCDGQPWRALEGAVLNLTHSTSDHFG